MTLRPTLLRADNFTPASRTPWGGRRRLAELKRDAPISPEKQGYSVVGESWEVSVEPDFPSVREGDGETLAALIGRDPAGWLGREAAAGREGTALLVKLLDADDELSVQIHPSDDYPALSAEESGKPESWYVVSREPGAGVYLGLAEGVAEGQMAEALSAGADVSKLLNFVPVEPGDFLVIDAGTAHAIGRGMTLVEPQRVVPGRRGLTYRYWDWNRRYDAQGRLDPNGAARALHLRDALAVTRWEAPRAGAFLALARVRAGEARRDGAPEVRVLCSKNEGLFSADLQVARIAGTGAAALPRWGAFTGLTVLDGAVTIDGVTVGRGRSAAIPATLGGALMELAGAHAVLSAVY